MEKLMSYIKAEGLSEDQALSAIRHGWTNQQYRKTRQMRERQVLEAMRELMSKDSKLAAAVEKLAAK